MINYTLIKACGSLNCAFIHKGLHMEQHLHLNVFMGELFLSARLRLEGRMGSRAKATNVVICLSTLWRLSNQNGNHPWMASQLFTNCRSNLMQPEVFSVWREERQICPMAVQINGLLK